MAKFICCRSENTGYIINVFPERVGEDAEEVNEMQAIIMPRISAANTIFLCIA